MKTLILNVTAAGGSIASAIAAELAHSDVVMLKEWNRILPEGCTEVVFVGALGICVRALGHLVKDKYTDPAVVCVDSTGKYAISVLSGHVGGANELTRRVAAIVGATPVITTQSDNEGLWALDTLAKKYGWIADASRVEMNKAIYRFVNGEKTALILDVKDRGTSCLSRTMPPNVILVNGIDAVPSDTSLIIAVTPYIYGKTDIPVLYFRPRVLELGVGCKKGRSPEGVYEQISSALVTNGISPLSVRNIATIELKKDEPLMASLASEFGADGVKIYSADKLKDIEVPNPSEKVREVTGVWGVAESAAMAAASASVLILEKQKCEDFTFAVAMDRDCRPGGHIEIVGAGPGDPELVSVRGKRFLSEADLILYAGSLVPRELTFYAKEGCVVRSSASMTLEEQFELMKKFYDRGLLVVRLHTGDPCIYGAIQEQMACFDRHGMSYHITPGISSFQAAAAALRSQFTIPEKVQTIILTRGEGRTPMPEKEKLCKLAQSQSTMCIYLSASVVDDVQAQLLQA